MENFWISSLAEELIQYISSLLSDGSQLTPSRILSIRKRFHDIEIEIISTACGIAESTLKAEEREKSYGNWWFTKATYEQSTAPAIARHHASRFSECQTITELCTGSGTDTAYLAKYAKEIVTYEADTLTAQIAQRNFVRNSLDNITVINAEAESFLKNPPYMPDGIWADPARRNKEQRFFSPQNYSPSFTDLFSIIPKRIFGIKVSPAFSDDYIPPHWKKEIIGFKNECREIVLWNGADIKNGTVHVPDTSLTWEPAHITEATILSPDNALYIVEPHPALIRSGYLGSFFAEHSLSIFDRRIGYAICEQSPTVSPWYRVFSIIDYFRYNEKNLQEKIRSLEWSYLTEIKKRGFFIEPEELRKKIKWSSGNKKGVIITTRYNDDYIVFLAERQNT